MLKRMKKLLASHHLGVLATSRNNQPHCSLMTYTLGEDGLTIFLLTLKDSRKYANLMANPRVGFLVDTRAEGGRGQIQALTVTAVRETFPGEVEQDYYKKKIAAENPHLQPLAEHPDVEVVCLRVKSFLLLEGALEAHYLEVT